MKENKNINNINKVIDFGSLKRNPIYKTIETGDIDNLILIYNPSPEQTVMIRQIIVDNAMKSEEDKAIDISAKDVLLKLIPELTNIEIDFDNEILIDDILDDPSDLLFEVSDILMEIVNKVANRLFKQVETIKELPENKQKEVIKYLDPKEQQRQREKKERLEKLKQIEEQRKMLEKQIQELQENEIEEDLINNDMEDLD